MKSKCLRCGWCCIAPKIPIVKLEFKDSPIYIDKTLEYFDKIREKKSGEMCPHLSFSESGISTCNVYHKEWFSTTLCYSFISVETTRPWYPAELLKDIHECSIGRLIRDEYPIDWWKHYKDYLPDWIKQKNKGY